MRNKQTIELRLDAARVIVRESAVGLPLEAGGILLGYRDGQRTVVTHALPVRQAHSSFDRYIRDDLLANAALQSFLEARSPDDPVGYVGEWHSHPSSVGPSSIDRAAIHDTAIEGGTQIALVVFAPWARSQFHGLVATPNRGWGAVRSVRVVTETAPTRAHESLPLTALRSNGPVFISYRHNDGFDRAEELERLLHAGGITVWRDIRDLPPGNTEDRIDQALASGLSAAVLIVTPDIVNSTVVRGRELPRLLELQQDQRFALIIASEIGRPGGPSLNFDAPDVLLGLAPQRILKGMDQIDVRTEEGRLRVVRSLLLHRVTQLKTEITSDVRPFSITTQSRVEPFAIDAGEADLDIRLIPAEAGKLPATQAVHDLRKTLPIVSDAVRASSASSIQVSGGMHLSIALALGAALPETRFGRVETLDLERSLWSSGIVEDDPRSHVAVYTSVSISTVSATPSQSRLAVFVGLTDGSDDAAFDSLISDATVGITSAGSIRAGTGRLDPREAGRLAREITDLIRGAARATNTSEVHLAYHGPYTMAVLLGRLLNTLRVVVYEWLRNDDGTSSYIPVVTLEPDVAGGPITAVHI